MLTAPPNSLLNKPRAELGGFYVLASKLEAWLVGLPFLSLVIIPGVG